MPLISGPFHKQRGERNRAGPCGCQAIFSRSAWSLRGCGGHITCGPQSWLGKSGCSFWGYFATQNVSHAVATPTDFNGANSCLQPQQFAAVCWNPVPTESLCHQGLTEWEVSFSLFVCGTMHGRQVGANSSTFPRDVCKAGCRAWNLISVQFV